MKESKKQIEREVKLLLLGAGDSGKSTFVKQMKLLHTNGYSKEELIDSKPLIYQNILLCFKALLLGCKKLQMEVNNENKEFSVFVNELQVITEDIMTNRIKEFKELWKDKTIETSYKESSQYQLPASCIYWMNNLERIAMTNYVPTVEDILRCRTVTTGIIETIFQVEEVPFRVVDVGGQRSERKKWIHAFEDVTAVIFLIAINEYDLKLVEDETVNRMHEAIQLWSDICNDKWLRKIPFIVFLNKSDLFKEKIEKLDMKMCFPDYEGGCNFENGVNYLENKIVSLNQNSDRPIYTYITCATDTENIKKIFAAVKSIILQSILDDNDF